MEGEQRPKIPPPPPARIRYRPGRCACYWYCETLFLAGHAFYRFILIVPYRERVGPSCECFLPESVAHRFNACGLESKEN